MSTLEEFREAHYAIQRRRCGRFAKIIRDQLPQDRFVTPEFFHAVIAESYASKDITRLELERLSGLTKAGVSKWFSEKSKGRTTPGLLVRKAVIDFILDRCDKKSVAAIPSAVM